MIGRAPRGAFAALLLALCASSHGSALLPVEVSQAGRFEMPTGEYAFSIRLDEERGTLRAFDLTVDGRVIDVPVADFPATGWMHLDQIRVMLARGEGFEHDGELMIPPYGVLTIELVATGVEACPGTHVVFVSVDTLDEYRLTMDQFCEVDHDDG